MPRDLGCVAHPKSWRAKAKVRRREIRMVERVQEVSTKLDFHRLCNRKILLHADVCIHISGSNGGALCRTISKRSRRGLGECAWTEPLNTLNTYRLRVADRSIAIRTI